MTEAESKEWFERLKNYHPNLLGLPDDAFTTLWEDTYQAFKARLMSEWNPTGEKQ